MTNIYRCSNAGSGLFLFGNIKLVLNLQLLGEDGGTIEHIVIKCNRFIKQRKEILDKYYNDKSIMKPIR